MTTAHVFIKGQVQGVNFRYYTQVMAEQLGLTGWIKNLPDRRVEVVFQGDKKKIEQAIAWCQKGPPTAYVEKVDIIWEDPKETFGNFAIRY